MLEYTSSYDIISAIKNDIPDNLIKPSVLDDWQYNLIDTKTDALGLELDLYDRNKTCDLVTREFIGNKNTDWMIFKCHDYGHFDDPSVVYVATSLKEEKEFISELSERRKWVDKVRYLMGRYKSDLNIRRFLDLFSTCPPEAMIDCAGFTYAREPRQFRLSLLGNFDSCPGYEFLYDSEGIRPDENSNRTGYEWYGIENLDSFEKYVRRKGKDCTIFYHMV